ncbi:MAG: prephenate dehydrogenase/arogenate dehydrogenase family protein [Pseudomonadota bacterium]
MFNKIVIFGVGLIGGSFALALRHAGLARRIVGVGRSRANLDLAMQRGLVDEAGTDAVAVQDADLVLLAIPVGQMGAAMAAMVPHLAAHAIVTDAGSTKQDVVALARRHLGMHLARFVPAHPIAGSEQTGAGAAQADLYQDKNVIMTPLAETDREALARVTQAWRACGARVLEMTPPQHDAVFAAVSHLPHVLAFALVDMIAAQPNREQLLQFAASGFRDFTRIAGSSPEMWRDIALANRDALLVQLGNYQDELGQLRRLLEAGDGASLYELFARASAVRNAWAEERNND